MVERYVKNQGKPEEELRECVFEYPVVLPRGSGFLLKVSYNHYQDFVDRLLHPMSPSPIRPLPNMR